MRYNTYIVTAAVVVVHATGVAPGILVVRVAALLALPHHVVHAARQHLL